MTRYEYFETWLTPKEWATWKKHSVRQFMNAYGITESEAKEARKRYLNEEKDFDSLDRLTIHTMFDRMIDHWLLWRLTPQGRDYWGTVSQRTAPIRTLTH